MSTKICNTCKIEYSGYKTLCPECGTWLSSDIMTGVNKKLKANTKKQNKIYARDSFLFGAFIIFSGFVVFIFFTWLLGLFGVPNEINIDWQSANFNIFGTLFSLIVVVIFIAGFIFIITGFLALLGFSSPAKYYIQFIESINDDTT
ncbi:MAG: hypothetical protein HeimC3_34590 [Candidatus Heimdallarchaeota archaeon LC_3]|nr:MAG: hypothetical protein HeimC3_34590 [Candidatus Heimdallarchaeota archaeon LC_3]